MLAAGPCTNSGVRYRLTNDAQADPLLSPGRSRLVNGLVELLVSFIQVYDGILGFVVDVLYRGFLLNDGSFHVLEQLCELNHLSLDLLDGLVSALHSAQCRLRLPSSIL